MAYDYAGEPMSGLTTLFVRIWRPSDGFFWNWTTGAFASSPSSADRDKTLVEASASLLTGLYSISWPGDVAGEYIAYIEQSSGGTDYTAPEEVLLVVGSLASAAAVATLQTSATDIQGRLPAVLVSGRIDASVGAVAANAITAASIATDAIDADAIAASAVSEIQSGLATAANVSASEAAIRGGSRTLADLAIPGDAMDLVVDAVDAGAVAASAVAEIQSGLATAGALTTAQTAISDLQTRTPAALVSGRTPAVVQAMDTDVLTAAAMSAAAVTKVQAGLATAWRWP
jgi:hypothetical protein